MDAADRLSYRYAAAIAQETLQELALVASITHRGEAGRAREGILRRFLSRVCPPGLGLDTGFVVDGLGGVSGQIDLVLYRPDYYPTFDIGGVKHFPVESVIAVFEVKASVDSEAKLHDALEQVESVKALDRTGGGSNYCLDPMRVPVDAEAFQFQVFDTVLAERALTAESAANVVEEFCAERPRRLWPNMMVAARDYSLRYAAPDRPPTEDPTIAAYLLASGPAGGGVPPLTDVAVALANIVRVSALIDFSPSNYFPSSTDHVLQRPLSDESFPGRREAGEFLGSGN